MANVSSQPGKRKMSVAEMIAEVEDGIYIIGDGSFSIDQQRYNAQFGGQLFFEIKNGKITQQIEDVAYQIRTPEFWNACAGVCDESDYRLGGSFFDGKGQPSPGHRPCRTGPAPRASTASTSSTPPVRSADRARRLIR